MRAVSRDAKSMAVSAALAIGRLHRHGVPRRIVAVLDQGCRFALLSSRLIAMNAAAAATGPQRKRSAATSRASIDVRRCMYRISRAGGVEGKLPLSLPSEEDREQHRDV